MKKPPAPARPAFTGRASVSPKQVHLKHLEPCPAHTSGDGGDAGPIPGWGDPLEMKMATGASILV